jgi:hypothetical protein
LLNTSALLRFFLTTLELKQTNFDFSSEIVHHLSTFVPNLPMSFDHLYLSKMVFGLVHDEEAE